MAIAATIIGVAGNVVAALILTFIRIAKKKSTESFSSVPYIASLLNCILWVLYGSPINKNAMLVVTINGLGTVLNVIYVLLFLFYARKSPKALYRIFKTKSVEFLPFYLCLTVFINSALWFVYALLKHDIYILVPDEKEAKESESPDLESGIELPKQNGKFVDVALNTSTTAAQS
ncbi:bidirectional sugar transporter SWEET1 [Selaginella moellendorffii]|uniref:bidirectional sugar transporter SWEET1 n=1 Tax=Selaginella moellendorffii TaxID=88036 RepID=UPI000D1CEC72|nr:bidirectional sugar transporter SWEET1 [Selaginella moellendorffii]|eukprot:XP_024525438.1 bidirectional sugar transporter SWEET1 [Selaginella moellendorffii]